MCPFCLSSIGLALAGAVSSGGLTALAVKVFRKRAATELPLNSEERNNANVDEHN